MKKYFFNILLLISILILTYLSFNNGSYHFSNSIFHLLFSKSSNAAQNVESNILWQIRIPRTMIAILVGLALGIAGVFSQTLFRNPLAEPTLIGLSGGATLGSAIFIGAGIVTYGTLPHLLLATATAFLVGLFIIAIAPKGTFSFLLTGIGFAAIFTAIAGIAIEIASNNQVQSITFWSFGSLALVTAAQLKILLIFLIPGVLLAFYLNRQIDIYNLGDSSAYYLGLSIKKTRYLILLTLILLVASCVSLVGSIAFLGLISPHIARFIVGPKSSILIVTSGLVGANLLLLSDILARDLISPKEIPVGLFTSLIGAPLLIFLLKSSKQVWSERE